MKFSMSRSVMLNDATDEPPFRMIWMAASTGVVLRALAIASRRLPRMVESRVDVMRSELAPPRRRRLFSMSATSLARVAGSLIRARSESRPPASAQRGNRDDPTLEPDAVYGY